MIKALHRLQAWPASSTRLFKPMEVLGIVRQQNCRKQIFHTPRDPTVSCRTRRINERHTQTHRTNSEGIFSLDSRPQLNYTEHGILTSLLIFGFSMREATTVIEFLLKGPALNLRWFELSADRGGSRIALFELVLFLIFRDTDEFMSSQGSSWHNRTGWPPSPPDMVHARRHV